MQRQSEQQIANLRMQTEQQIYSRLIYKNLITIEYSILFINEYHLIQLL